MPSSICFSYPENVPPDRRGPTNSACFGYSVGELLDQGGGKTTTACFSYQSDIPSGVRRMPYSSCFSYPDSLSRGGNSDAVQPRGPQFRRMPIGGCFRY